MKSISAALDAHLALPRTTMATCWKVTRADATVLGFTDHDTNLSVSGVTYLAATGYTASDVATSNNLDTDDLEIEGLLSSPSITEDDLRAGLWDHAQIEIFQVNWADLTQGTLRMRTGWLGQVSQGRTQFKAELLGLMWRYQTQVVELTSAACRADFGDARCKVTESLFTVLGTVDAFDATTLVMTDAARAEAADYYAHGKITFTTGANTGLTFEVKSSVVGALTLQLPPPYTLAIGTDYSLVAGCDKKRETCRDRFTNIVNFRGEPFLSGNDRLVQVGRHK